MRSFTAFLFENFDPEREADNPLNPRRLLREEAYDPLSFVLERDDGANEEECLTLFGEDSVRALKETGVLRSEGGRLMADAPVFLREEAGLLRKAVGRAAAELADRLERILPGLFPLLDGIRNGFEREIDLYHVLCGMTFDGSFFDCLGARGALAVSHKHGSGLDYIAVLYEDCPELKTFSDRLLCSWNRFTDGRTSLQSFGDADGIRRDFYRAYRLRERGTALPGLPADLPDRETVLTEARKLLDGSPCSQAILRLLDGFGYTENGRFRVPVYRPEDRVRIEAVGRAAEEGLGDAAASALEKLSAELPLRALKQGADRRETANELWHLLFGTLNEELVRRGYAAKPPYRPGEGRYLCSARLSG